MIELMITLSVLAILVAVGVPSFQGMIARNRIATATNDIVSGMYAARSEAIKRNASIRFCINLTEGSWQVRTLTGESVKVGELSGNVDLEQSGLDTGSVAGSACVRFGADGLSYGTTEPISNGTLSLSLADTSGSVINVRVGAVNVD